MAYVYICDSCRRHLCDRCEQHRDLPSTESSLMGGGFCVCSHGRADDRSEFEQSVWGED